MSNLRWFGPLLAAAFVAAAHAQAIDAAMKLTGEARTKALVVGAPSPFANVQLKFIDPAEALDKQQQWIRQYDDVVIRGAK